MRTHLKNMLLSSRPSGLGISPGFGVAARSRLEMPSILLGLPVAPDRPGLPRLTELSTREKPPPVDIWTHDITVCLLVLQ